MMRKRASIKGIGASIYSATNDSAPIDVQSESRSRSTEAEKLVTTPCAEPPVNDGSAPGSPSRTAAPARAEPEPAPLRIRAERQPLPRPRLHIVPSVQTSPAAEPAQPTKAEPSESPVRDEPVQAPIDAQPTPIDAQPAPDSAPVDAQPAPASAPVDPQPTPASTPAESSAPAPVILERAPDGGPDAPSTPPGPIAPILSDEAPSADLKSATPDQESTARTWLGDDLRRAMLEEIGALYERVVNTSGAHLEMAERAMDQLSTARDLLLLGSAGDFNLAERRVNEAKLILNRIDQSRSWSNTYGWGLLLYELVLFAGLVMAIIFDRGLAQWFGVLTGSGAATPSMSVIFPPWSTMLWGGIGGIVGALYSLHWHVAELQDFDRQYSFWYIVQPIMGLILGGIIHLVIVTGMLALVPVAGAGDSAKVAASAVNWFPSLLACLAGFRQKFAYELMDNIMKTVGRQPASTAKSNV